MSKNTIWIIVGIVALVIIAIVSFLPSNTSPSQTAQAEVMVLADNVRVGFRTLTSGDKVNVGATIITDSSGRAEITMPDGSLVRLAENGKLKIESIEKTTSLKLLAGRLFSRVAQALDRDSFEVSTATTVATVRGTVFGLLRDRLDKVIGLQRTTEISKPNQDETIDLNEGHQVVIDSNTALEDTPIDLTDSEKAWLKWNLEREAELGVSYGAAIMKLIKETTTPTTQTPLPSQTPKSPPPSSSPPPQNTPLPPTPGETPWRQGPSQ